jgi:hypothetical protein
MRDERDMLPTYGPECCSSCGEPFNNAEASRNGMHDHCAPLPYLADVQYRIDMEGR